MNYQPIFLLGLLLMLLTLPVSAKAVKTESDSLHIETEEPNYADELEQIRMHMPDIEVGNGISFQPKNKSYKLTMRIRMQNLVDIDFNDKFEAQDIDARVKRLRLRFDGYIYTPKLTYLVQLGFSPYDMKTLPNGNSNIVRDAMIYYVPNATWNIGFGQTKIRANRARINSSSALQFVDRSIVNSEFNLDRDFGFFGEYNQHLFGNFDLAAKASVTTGEGRNWGNHKGSGLAYTGRVELFPMGRFTGKGDAMEGDYEREQTPKILLAGAYSYNDRALRAQGSNGDQLLFDQTRNLSSYFVDFIFKYQGFAFYTDFMGRICHSSPLIKSKGVVEQYVLTGYGLNVQASYLFPSNWEIALRNSTIIPEEEVQPYANYRSHNQSTIGVTKYLIDHRLKVQTDLSYNYKDEFKPTGYNRWQLRFQVELGF